MLYIKSLVAIKENPTQVKHLVIIQCNLQFSSAVKDLKKKKEKKFIEPLSFAEAFLKHREEAGERGI